MIRLILLLLSCLSVIVLTGQPIKPYGALPSPQQIQWHETGFYWFIHFGPNTFTDREWGEGTEDPSIFNPTQLDCRQWARIAVASGAKGIIITAKHHDGFCLFPSQYSTHTVRESPWRNGQGDLVKELSEACKAYHLKFGVYISPWDRNHPKYGTDEYNDVYINTMNELLTHYGPLFELWWDGANGEGPNGRKQVYDFPRFEKAVFAKQPGIIIFSDVGPGTRWCGNESGAAGETNWNTLNTKGFTPGAGGPPQDSLNRGNEDGKRWIPAESDVSIRPGWFYHAAEDSMVKSVGQLMQIYDQTIGRGSNLILNVPPDRRGLINEIDSARLVDFGKSIADRFRVNLAKGAKVKTSSNRKGFPAWNLTDGRRNSAWAAMDKDHTAQIDLTFPTMQAFSQVLLQEYIEKGQRVRAFTVSVEENGQFREVARGTTIGFRRIVSFPEVRSAKIRIEITDSKACPVIAEVKAFK